MPTDQIDEAIAAAAEHDPETQPPSNEATRHTLTVTLSGTGGRHVVMNFPIDLDDEELLEWVAFMSGSFHASLEATRAALGGAPPPPQIEIARSMPADLTARLRK